ncbi:hypothetical protein V1512DRAFT_213267 [Lipomyces arxii]|uniref:uncharacterized protein n=1 Tax=Lipomyces arxii TaxID=56418 RepID=UPI0034CFBEDE
MLLNQKYSRKRLTGLFRNFSKSSGSNASTSTNLPPLGNPRPATTAYPLIAYPLVERDLQTPSTKVGFYSQLFSSTGYSQILDIASWASGVEGPYPIINWQHWIRHTKRQISVSNGLLPTLSMHKSIQKVLFIPKYYWDLLKHLVLIRNKYRDIKNRVNLPSFKFQSLVRSVLFSEICYNPPPKIGNRLPPEFLFEYKGQEFKVQPNDGERSTEKLNIYIPDQNELSHADFQFARRNGSPLFLPLILSTVLLCSVTAKYILPRLATSLDLEKSCRMRHITRWEQRIQQSQDNFVKSRPVSQHEVLKLQTAQLTTPELTDAAKAFGLLPSWFHPSIAVRPLMLEKLQNHLNYLRADNILIGKWGGLWQMSEAELDWALLERGASCTNLTLEQKQAQLYIIIVAMTDLRYEVSYLMLDTALTNEETKKVFKLRKRLGFEINDIAKLTSNTC